MKITQKELNDDQIMIISEDETTRTEDTRKKENFELLKTVVFNNNKISLIENYKNGKLHGKYEQYFENGSLQISGEYREGEPCCPGAQKEIIFIQIYCGLGKMFLKKV